MRVHSAASRHRRTMADFGERLTELRRLRRLTQSQLADLLDAAEAPVISRWENGVSKPQLDYVVKVAQVLELGFDRAARRRL